MLILYMFLLIYIMFILSGGGHTKIYELDLCFI